MEVCNNGKVEKRSTKSQRHRLYGLRAGSQQERAVLMPSKQNYTARDTRTDGTEVVYPGAAAIGIVNQNLLSPLYIASTITKEERYCYYLLRMSGAWRRKETDATVAELTSL